MRVLSLFSGAGGMDIGLHAAGHTLMGLCEIDPVAREVLRRHWPDTPIHEDVTTLDGSEYRGRVDIVCGGSPCQDLSLAGRRAGLDGQRSSLFWHQCRIADEADAPWILWENVPGALSSNGGRDFASVLWGLTGYRPEVPTDGWRSTGVCVGDEYTAVWRLLDAQHFGVPQRRKRIFVVRGPRDSCGIEILVERESSPWDSAPVRAQRSQSATSAEGGSGHGRSDSDSGGHTSDGDQRGESGASPDGSDGGSGRRGDGGSRGSGDALVDPQLEIASTLKARDWKGTGFHEDTGKLVITDASDQPVPFVKTRRAQTSTDVEGWDEGRPAPTITAFDQGDTRTTVAVVHPEYEVVEEALPDVAHTLHAEDGRLQMLDNQSAFQGRHIVMRRTDEISHEITDPVMMDFQRRDDIPKPSDVAPTLTTNKFHGTINHPMVADAVLFDGSRFGDPRLYEDVSPTLVTRMGTGGNNVPWVVQPEVTDD